MDTAVGGEELLVSAVEAVEALLGELRERSPLLDAIGGRLVAPRAVELAELVETVLVPAALAADRARGASWARIAAELGVDESTARRRYRSVTAETIARARRTAQERRELGPWW